MSAKWAKRIQKLESILLSRARPPVVFRYGPVRYLRDDVTGERHIVVSESHATSLPNVVRCEFEERVGPRPEEDDDLNFNVHLDLREEGDQPSPGSPMIRTLPSEASSIAVRQERIF
jgi:hypothetical protein